MSRCPKGHQSEASDYCDVCGARIEAPGTTPGPIEAPGTSPGPIEAPGTPPGPIGGPVEPAPAPAPASAPASASAAPPGVATSAPAEAAGSPAAATTRPCQSCGVANPAANTFCEDCGADLDPAASTRAPSEPPGEQWEMVANADRAHFDSLAAEGIEYPSVYVERRFALRGNQVSIGRRSTRKGINPDIDLSAAPEDVGVSHQHAVLTAGTDGAWSVIDPGSANGIYLNDNDELLPSNQPVALADGDRLRVGAWTTLTIHRLGDGAGSGKD